MDAISILFVLALLYWITPIVLFIIGLIRIRSRPEFAKKLLIAAGIMFLVGVGVCGVILAGL